VYFEKAVFVSVVLVPLFAVLAIFAVFPLLHFQLVFPGSCDVLEPILQPNQVLTEAPVRWQHGSPLVDSLRGGLGYLPQRLVVVNVPKLFAAELNLIEEASGDVTQLLLHVLELLEVVRELLFLTELDWRVLFSNHFVNDAFEAGLATGYRFVEHAFLFVGVHKDHSLQVVRHVLETQCASALENSVSVECSADPEIRKVETYLCAIFEFQGCGPAKTRSQRVPANASNVLVISRHAPVFIGPFKQVVTDRWVVACVLAVEPAPVREAALVRLAKQRVERLVLICTQIITRN